MDYIESGSPQDDFTKTLNERVEILRSDNGLERKYMTIQQTISAYQRNARDEGIAIGREEGIGIGREEGIGIGEARGMKIGREEGIGIGREEGIGIGEARGELSAFCRMVKSGIISAKQAAESMNISVGEFQQRAGAFL